MKARHALFILPALAAIAGGRHSFILTRKFVAGVVEYTKHWPGPVIVCLSRAQQPDTNLDQIEVHANDVPFSMEWLPECQEGVMRMISHAGLVLASLVDEHVHLADSCAALNLPLVYVSEYTLLTRRQIIRAETQNPLVRWRREMWTVQLERKLIDCVRQANGIQCSGTPTYNAYRGLNRRALLYFDTRVRSHQLVPSQILEARTAEMMDGRPLQLAFSGRLIPMKGPDHLPKVACELRRLGVRFTMDIYGAGSSEPLIRQAIHKFNLGDSVRLRGVLDFELQLMPAISRQCDLFVCCHRQGDPSCTYLETFSCGTPMIGYDNEALHGLIGLNGCGWTVPMDRPDLLAKRIAELDRQRSLLLHAAFAARKFAARHTFEKTMQIRIDHMLTCAQPLQVEAKAS